LIQLNKYGFDSQAEFEAFSYTDFCFKQFIEAAKKQQLISTIPCLSSSAIMVWRAEAGAMYPKAWTSQRLSDEHVPLLFYAPALLEPARHSFTVSQVDVLPTLAGMLHQTYTNAGIGRDVLNQTDILHAAFIIHHDEANIGIVTDDYYYIKNLNISKEDLVPVKENLPTLSTAQSDAIKKKLSQLAAAIYETGKWMLVNNK
jgi:phosphoglycerol transferase MdoB-like AlkP superfamily enzyme